MATKVISFSLDAGSIKKAIQELDAYADDLKHKCEILRQKVAERVRWSAEQGFSNALVSDIIRGSYEPVNDVQVTVSNDGDVSVVIASGNEAVFIEYGAGVYYNGNPGDSPHPWGLEQGYAIGTYGKGKGVRNAWNIDKTTVTRGTPAAMPMYRGAEEAIRYIGSIVREVFG